MRTTTLLFIFGLVAFAAATKQNNVFAEIEATQFGSSLMDLVQMNMQSNSQAEMTSEDSLNQISDLLNDIQSDMQTNKKVADAEHKDFQAKAATDIAQYQRIIKEQQDRLAQTVKQLAHDRKQLADTRAELASAQRHLVQVNAQIKAADEADRVAVLLYAKTVKELKEAIAACKEAVVELAKLSSGVFAEGETLNMAQIKAGMQKVEFALTQHMPARLAIYKPIITALVDMGTNANPELVKKVVGLINELRGALETQLAQTHTNEKQRVADYVKLRADLVNDQTQTENRIGRLESLIKSLVYNIAQNAAVEAGLRKTIPQQQQLLKIRQEEQRAEQAQYEQDDAQRVQELKVIDQLIKYFASKIANMSEYLRNRVAH